MKLIRNIVIAAVATMAVACGHDTGSLTDAGVSMELAESRNASIADISYSLEFTIPSSLDEDVSGKETLRFNMDSPSDLILDFTSERFGDVQVNGKTVDAKYENEHIVIPKSSIKRGENEVALSFTSDGRFLNRNEEYLYTLFVPAHARSVFPCFDQPDMKARFQLSLNLPEGWVSMSNTAIETSDGKHVQFARTKLIPTYLFSFVAGKWQSYTAMVGGREVTAFYRETDPDKIAQLPDIFKELETSIAYMEEYTGIKLPFEKYGFTIVPGFQFGGMEHPGAVLYNENTMFLGKNPTPDDREKRITLIAHETSHMWFGDMVTMKWFNDVWTKEVYANYFAALIAEPMFPDVNHDLAWMKSYYVSALAEDRTEGTTPVRRPLGNLADAGLIYSNIVYDKAPIVMRKLVEFMGEDNFRKGICSYLQKYAYGNATWDDLIEILDSCSDRDVKAFSDAWIYSKGMPSVSFEHSGDSLVLRQGDKYGRGILWPQSLSVAFDDGRTESLELGGADTVLTVYAGKGSLYVPNSDGRAYGLFVLPVEDYETLLGRLGSMDDTSREATLLTVYEDYMQGRFLSSRFYVNALLDQLERERNPQIASTIVGELSFPMLSLYEWERVGFEKRLIKMSGAHPLPSVRHQLLSYLMSSSTSSQAAEYLYDIWSGEKEKSFGDDAYSNLSFQLCIRMPEKAHEILAVQRSRIDGSDPGRTFNADRLRRFDFVSRAAVPEQEKLDSLFNSLLLPENRIVEPWAESALALLNHPLRDKESVKYIVPGLDALEDVKATGDIFFPSAWCRALLSGHRSTEAYAALRQFLSENPDYPQLLMDKIRVSSYNLERSNMGFEEKGQL